ncbi:hypothetical protein ANN_14162 [Periplaneta americana]|uniref:Uncharacterized protein n=1 Tax=Periplaneta americana TaxID=6978 RepID=A0ABQ8SVJ2_PERAM|nr:hypothetical protein ANN_14162 [Periplaneta americana]
MDLKEVGYDDRDWINLAQDRGQWRAYVREAMNLRVLKSHFPLKLKQVEPNSKPTASNQAALTSNLQQPPKLQPSHPNVIRIQNQAVHNNPTFIYNKSIQLNITPPRQTWSAKYNSTTLTFISHSHMETFISNVPPSTFGPNADFNIRTYNPTTTSASQNFQISRETNVVAGGLAPEIETTAISQAMTEKGISHTRITRILNNNGPTPLVCIFSTDETTIASLLDTGLQLWGRTYQCKPPKLSARHLPYRNCHQYLHTKQNCLHPTVCFQCGKVGNKCSHTQRSHHCATCKTDGHYTGQMHCPLYLRDVDLPDEPTYHPLIKRQAPLSPTKPSKMPPPPPPELTNDNFPAHTNQQPTLHQTSPTTSNTTSYAKVASPTIQTPTNPGLH